MGLGKSVQVIGRLVQEKEQVNQEDNLTTLLIAPTSVVGNWQKEIAKFAPHLKTIVHHRGDRCCLHGLKPPNIEGEHGFPR